MRRDSERICHSIEEREHRGDVNGFCDLLLGPSNISEPLHICRCRSRRRLRHLPHVFHQLSLGFSQPRTVEIALSNCRNSLLVCSLNPQEVCMAIDSIRTPIQVGDISGQHLFVTARKMAFTEMDGI